MADFKISRIRYTWKGNWNTSILYKKDDVLFYGGSSWVCVRQHTSSVFHDDLEFTPPGETAISPAWRKMTDGRVFRGEWQSSTLYDPGNIVKYGGNLYLVVDSYTSTSSFQDGISNLSSFIESINWRGTWTAETLYAVGDLVRYGAKTLKCTLEHTSATAIDGPEVGNNDGIEDSTLEQWELYYSAPDYRGDYSSSSVRYRADDVVLFNGSLIKCIVPFISSGEFQADNWTLIAEGQEYTVDWQNSRLYSIGSVVRYGGNVYRALRYGINQIPTNSIYQFDEGEPYWQQVAQGVNYLGVYSSTVDYKAGDVVLRGGILYKCLIDTDIADDASTLDYLDSSNWQILVDSINFKGSWTAGITYQKGDAVGYLGSLYRANIAHVSASGLDANFPGDNGSGYDYWDLILEAQTEVGMSSRGDLLTFNLSKSAQGDQSTFGVTSVPIGADAQVLTIDQEQDIFYKTYGEIARTYYVSTDGVDDNIDPRRGSSEFRPWRTIQFACEQADDGFTGSTTIKVNTGKFEEILPIIVPARTVVRGDELRSVTIAAAGANAALINDDTYTLAVLSRIKSAVNFLVGDSTASYTKAATNPLDPVIVEGTTQSEDAADDLLDSIDTIIAYIRFNIDGIGSEPVVSGSNTAVTDLEYTDAVTILEANKEFLAAEAVAFVQQQYPSYVFDINTYKKNVRKFINAIKYDIIYTGNYKSILAARHYVNSIQGSTLEDMFYLRDSTGVRNCTLIGLNGTLSPITPEDLYPRPTGGAYTSLDPGWGPADSRTWITTRSPYIQGVTNIGDRCVGMKVDGALHNGGNKSMVANDYTQVLSDGIGAWVENDGRTELVSVFSYYCAIGYYAKSGGTIRATNGNNSYGDFGCVSDGVDPTEVPEIVAVNNRNQQAQAFQALSGEFVDEIAVLEFTNAGQKYTTASASFTGSGINASVSFEDFRDNAIYQARLLDDLPSATFVGSISETELTVTAVISGAIGLGFRLSGTGILEGTQILSFGTASGLTGTYTLNRSQTVTSTTINAVTSNLVAQYVGGGGYSIQQNNAQVHSTPNGDLTSITIASNDANLEADYLGKRIIIVSGTGTGQYAYITAYNTITKVVSVSRDSDDQPGWDHLIPGRPLSNPLDTTTRYRIEPRVVFSSPEFAATEFSTPVTSTYNNMIYGEITRSFNNVAGDLGTGSVIEDDGLTVSAATFNITQTGRTYSVTVNDPGAGYLVGDVITIEGDDLGGAIPDNDITITVTGITDDSTDSITAFTFEGTASSGKFIGVPAAGSQGISSLDGETWTAVNLPSAGDWRCLAAGDNRFVAIRYGSNVAASSNDGSIWTARTMPASRNWNAVVYGGDKFVAVAGDQNSGAYSTNGTTWTAMSMPAFGDSTFNEWIDIAYGKGIYVAVANSGNISASSTDGINWTGHIMDVIADSTQKDWTSVTYGNNRFVAVSSQGDVAYSFDGELWYPATMPTQDGSTAHVWYKIRYAQGVFFAVGDTGSKDVGGDATAGPSTFAATSPDGINWTGRELATSLEWRAIGFGNPFIPSQDSTVLPNTPMWIAAAANSDQINKITTGATAIGRAYVASGQITRITLIDAGSGYTANPTITIIDPSSTSDAVVEARLGDGVLSNPEWINRGLGYRTTSTTVTISGDGFADIIPAGKFVTINDLDGYPGVGSQIQFSGNAQRYIITAVTELGTINGGLSASLRLLPEIKVRDNLEHGTPASIRDRFSQCRITGHDFLDIGTGNFTETNYPDLYATGDYLPQPENEVYEEDGGRVFYTATDQSGNFRTGELFAVEQATGIVTISADFFDLAGLTELKLGGIRIGGSGVVIREFSTDALFTADSNNIVPTQRAIAAYLNNRLTVGGSEIITSSFIAGLIRVGPDLIDSTIDGVILIPQRVDFEGDSAGVSGLMISQSMFLKSFSSEF